MQIEKEFLSLNPRSFYRIEDYLAHVKERLALYFSEIEEQSTFPYRGEGALSVSSQRTRSV
jgi:hypothetical protein